MISFDEGRKHFTYRVAGIVIDKNRVLLQKVDDYDFLFLPGGRAELLETSKETLKREMREEIGTEIRVIRLVWVMENFYPNGDKSYHELGFYHKMGFPEKSPLYEQDEFFREDEGYSFTFKWYELNEITDLPIYPTFLRTGLQKIPDSTEHIIHHDQQIE